MRVRLTISRSRVLIIPSMQLIITYFLGHSLPSVDSKKAAVSHWRNKMHWVLFNRLKGLSLHRKSVVILPDRLVFAVDVNKNATQQICNLGLPYLRPRWFCYRLVWRFLKMSFSFTINLYIFKAIDFLILL